jgi:hypothetical protein
LPPSPRSKVIVPADSSSCNYCAVMPARFDALFSGVLHVVLNPLDASSLHLYGLGQSQYPSSDAIGMSLSTEEIILSEGKIQARLLTCVEQICYVTLKGQWHWA